MSFQNGTFVGGTGLTAGSLLNSNVPAGTYGWVSPSFGSFGHSNSTPQGSGPTYHVSVGSDGTRAVTWNVLGQIHCIGGTPQW
jgi:hypothetical protein